MKKIFTFMVLALLLIFPLMTCADAETSEPFSPYVDAKGKITRPIDYRGKWVHLGSWIVPDENAAGYGFHDVYTQASAFEAYKQTGKFPDGAALVKDIRKVNTATMTTGQASWAGDINAWFVMIKDQKGRFPENANWGNGWGWALFEAKEPDKNVSTSYKKDCLGCHLPAKDSDYIYVEGYPTLK